MNDINKDTFEYFFWPCFAVCTEDYPMLKFVKKIQDFSNNPMVGVHLAMPKVL